MRDALGNYEGIYMRIKPENLTENEIKRHEDSIKTARELAEHFSEILHDYYAIETGLNQFTP